MKPMSHLLQMRGLKLLLLSIFCMLIGSHLLQMRGLKLAVMYGDFLGTKSHLLQMRGLKQSGKWLLKRYRSRIFYRCVDWNFNDNREFEADLMSHLLQMRGLKQFYITRRRHYRRRIFYRCVDWNKSYGPGVIACMVASFTDAWIETRLVVNVWFVAAVASFTDAWIETMRRHYIDVLRGSHLLQMRGLKHSFRENVKKDRSRIFYRCVDWNK